MSIIVTNNEITKSYNKFNFMNKKIKILKEVIKKDFDLNEKFELNYNSIKLDENKLISKYFSNSNDIILVVNKEEYNLNKIKTFSLMGILLLFIID